MHYAGNVSTGKAPVTVKGAGNYMGSIARSYIIKPAKCSMTSLRGAKGSFTVRYKKQNGASYQISYRKSGAKEKTVKTSAVSKTVKKLKKGTYTVKVRAYKKTGSVTYYGSYSKAKTVKVR